MSVGGCVTTGVCVTGAGAAVPCPQAERRKARVRNVEKRFFVFMLIPFASHARPAVNHRLFLQWMLSALVLRIIQIENLVAFPFGDFAVHDRLYPFAMPRRGFYVARSSHR